MPKSFSITLSRPGIFGAPLAREGHIVPNFQNHVPLLLTPYCLVFQKACPKLNHMIHVHLHGNRFKCFKVAQRYFYAKPQIRGILQMAIVFVHNASSNTIIVVYTYLRLTFNGTYVGIGISSSSKGIFV